MWLTWQNVLRYLQHGLLSAADSIGCRLEHIEPFDGVNYFVPNIAYKLVPILVDEARYDVGVRTGRVSGKAYGCNGVSCHYLLTVKVKQLVAVHEQNDVFLADKSDHDTAAFVTGCPGFGGKWR